MRTFFDTHANPNHRGHLAHRIPYGNAGTSVLAILYGGKMFGDGPMTMLNLMFGDAYSWRDINTRRHVDTADLNDRLKAGYSGQFGKGRRAQSATIDMRWRF